MIPRHLLHTSKVMSGLGILRVTPQSYIGSGKGHAEDWQHIMILCENAWILSEKHQNYMSLMRGSMKSYSLLEESSKTKSLLNSLFSH